jgi:hypothetical protein
MGARLGKQLRKRKMAKLKILFINGLYKNGQVDSPFQGWFCVEKPQCLINL